MVSVIGAVGLESLLWLSVVMAAVVTDFGRHTYCTSKIELFFEDTIFLLLLSTLQKFFILKTALLVLFPDEKIRFLGLDISVAVTEDEVCE